MRSHLLALFAALSVCAFAGPAAARPAAVGTDPAHVVLDPSLANPQPGDSPATLAARHRLGALITQVQQNQETFDAAAEAATAAEAALAKARAVYAADQAIADEARAELVATAVRNYVSGIDTAPQLGAVATSTDPSSLLERLAVVQQIAAQQATITQAANATAVTAAAAKASQAAAQAKAQAARTQAQTALAAAQAARVTATSLVVSAHLSDVRAQAAAARANVRTVAQAAATLKAQTLATGAASEADYLHTASPAAVIAVADNALLRQAAGRTPPPPPKPVAGVPGFAVPTFGPVDEQAVMGPTPDLGRTARYAGKSGVGPVRSLDVFQNDPVQTNWPNPGVGLGVPGTAKPLPANGVTVNPVIAQPKAPVLRAGVAVDAALAQLGRPYVWDAAGPSTFDCSGLTLWAWGHAGIGLPHFAADQALAGVRVAPNELLPGDLILFGSGLHHVGLYLGAGFMIDAPDTGDYVKIQRVSDDGDFSIAVRL